MTVELVILMDVGSPPHPAKVSITATATRIFIEPSTVD
jgi:hypothetical protein